MRSMRKMVNMLEENEKTNEYSIKKKKIYEGRI